MTVPFQAPAVSRGLRVNVVVLAIATGLLAAILLAAGVLALRQAQAQEEVRRSLDIMSGLNRVLSDLLDAETGQRGYLITRNAIIHNGVVDPGVNFIAKPFTLEGLGQKIRRIFDDGLPGA